MYKATDPAKITLLADKAKSLDVSQLINIKSIFKTVKEHSEECKIERSIIVRDFYQSSESSHRIAPYLNSATLWKNIKEGNTLLEIYDPADYKKILKTVIARRGQAHIFDLSLNFVSDEHKYNEQHLDKNQIVKKNYILAPLKKAISQEL